MSEQDNEVNTVMRLGSVTIESTTSTNERSRSGSRAQPISQCKEAATLCVTETFHNIRLQPGLLTPSDHTPIIATISANPIQIPIRPRPFFHNADWTQYKSLLTTHTVPQDPQPTLEKIDNHPSNWESHITAASNQAIPTITHRTIQGIKPTQETLLLQIRYHHTCNHLRRHGHSPHLYCELVNLRHQIKQTYKRIYSATWNHTITNMKINDNPKQFWSSVKRMSSNNTKQSTPCIKLNVTYYHSPSDKEPLFRTHWSNIYSGVDDPDNKFDENHIHDVETQMTNITPQLKPRDRRHYPPKHPPIPNHHTPRTPTSTTNIFAKSSRTHKNHDTPPETTPCQHASVPTIHIQQRNLRGIFPYQIKTRHHDFPS
ncbi:hypothetical protein FHG87_011646 [Trinorchestia longiramus]|nr:hypothetical protein FHG87_011646 [Trinorchestia longiramus]